MATGQPRAILINKLMAHPKVVRAARPYVAGNPATLDWGQEGQNQAGSPDDHMQTMDGLSAQ